MSKPKINFLVSKEQDKDNLRYYLKKWSYGGQDSFKILIHEFPQLEVLRGMNDIDQEKLINSFIDEKYNELNDELKINLEDIKKRWSVDSEAFYEETQKLFGNFPWPEGECTVYLTVFCRFRCDSDKKRFFIPRNQRWFSQNLIIMHEMLHIYIKNYWKNNLKIELSEQKYNDFVEVLITLMMNKPEFLKIAGKESIPYPSHKDKYEQLKLQFNQNNSINEFVVKVFESGF